MSDQNQFDQYKQKLLHYWSLFLAACGRIWDKAKTNTKVLAQKLSVLALQARDGLKKAWAVVRYKGRQLLQKLAAWALEVREKLHSLTGRAGEWLGAVTARFQRTKSDESKELPPVAEAQEAPALPEAEETPQIQELPVPAAEAQSDAAEQPGEQEQTKDPNLHKERTALGSIGAGVKLVFKWIWRLRKVFMAVPVIWAAVKLAMENMDRLPESVGLDIQSTGEFARMITRTEAVYWPLGITLFCLLLTFFAKKPLLPWVISVFTLVLPWLIWLLNFYA